MELCASTPLLGGANPAKEAAVFRALLQGLSEGWLHQGLVQLGAAVWAAWPQKYACNDDMCLKLDCITESSCGRLHCTACKVSNGPDETLREPGGRPS